MQASEEFDYSFERNGITSHISSVPGGALVVTSDGGHTTTVKIPSDAYQNQMTMNKAWALAWKYIADFQRRAKSGWIEQ